MATYISKQSGLWSSASTWLTAANGTFSPTADAGAAPQSGAGDRFIIRGGNVVEYDVIGEFGDDGSYWPSSDDNLLLNAIALSATNSTLKVSRTTSTSLSCRGSIGIGNGCIFDWGTTTDPLTASGVTSEIILGTNSSTISTTLSTRCRSFIANPPFNSNNRINVTVCGKSKTRNTTLSGNHTTGSTTITAVDVTGWNVGDRIVIEPPRFDNSTYINMPIQLSTVNITNINGNVVTLNTPLETNYSSGLAVGNFSSNITIKPARFIPGNLANPSPAAATQQRPVAAGFVLSLGSNLNSVIDIRNVSFENLIGDGTVLADNNNATNPNGCFAPLHFNIADGLVPVTLDNIYFFPIKIMQQISFVFFKNQQFLILLKI